MPAARYRPAMDIAPEQVAELQREGTIQLVDVREPYEWEAGRIPGARHVALGAVAAEAETLSPDVPVVFVCRVGGRSTMAADAFRRAGYDAYSLAGGVLAWEASGLPFDGEVADH
jgi:hydroxyacylglutathione hydrolase/adenylyltransferase/sulfurtransferase